MYISREKLYSLGEPFGNDCTRREGRRIIYGKGGSQSSTTVQSIPEELKGLATAYANKATNLADQPYQPYTDQRYAGPTGAEQYGLNMVADRAMNGDPTMKQGAKFLQGALKGGSISGGANNSIVNGGTNNAFVDGGVNNSVVNGGTNSSVVKAGTNTAKVSAGSNQYMGSNPYLDAQVNRAQENVANNWNNMTKPQTEAAGVRSGSFGNSGMDQTLQNQQVAAGKQMGDIASQMYGADYANTQQLAEAGLNRNVGTQQFNANTADNNLNRSLNAQQFNSNTVDSNLARSLNAQQFNSNTLDSNLARGLNAQQFNSNTTDSNLARGLNAQQFNSNTLDSNFARSLNAQQSNASNGLQAAQLAPTYGAAAYNDAQQMTNAGAYARNFDQQNKDFNYQQFQDQSNLPYKQLGAMSGVFGSNLGGTSTTTSSGGGK